MAIAHHERRVRSRPPFRTKVCAGLVGAATALLPLKTVGAQQPIEVHGSTTFQSDLLEPNLAVIERRSGLKLHVVPNKSIWGLLALIEGRADVAMISTSLNREIDIVQSLVPNTLLGDLREYPIAEARAAFAVHPSNSVRRLKIATLKKILDGEISNWRDIGGPDLKIVVVATKDGGDAIAAVAAGLLAGKPVRAPGAIRLESPMQVVKVVAQEPGALGIAQVGLAEQENLPEIATDRPVTQPLNLVIRGAPSAEITALISALKSVASENMD